MGRVPIRILANIDATETRADQAKCVIEQTRGKAVTKEAIAMLKGHEVSLVRVGRSYNRTVASRASRPSSMRA
jgi:hypothetical protein